MKKNFIYLMATALLMIVSAAAMAQDGTNPYAGSTHTYTITPDATTANKTYAWSISGGGTINGATDGTSLNVTWGSTTGTYTVTFTETDTITSCYTQRELDVSVIANTFNLTMSADAEECHDSTGLVLGTGASGPTTIYFTANLNKDAGWTIDSWEYDFSVAIAGSYSLVSVSVDSGADLGTSGNYANNSVSGSNTTSEIAVVVSGAVTSGDDVTVALSNGFAIKGTTTTPDNGTGDKTQVLTINPLPNTSAITTD